MKRLKKKLKSMAGASLAETLLVVLLLAIMGSAITGGISAAVNAHKKALRKENAEILSDTVLSTLRFELDGAEYLGESTVTEGDASKAVSCFLIHSKDKLNDMQVGFWINKEGKLMVSYFTGNNGTYREITEKSKEDGAPDFTPKAMLTDKSYTDSLIINSDIIEKPSSGEGKQMLTITARIFYKDKDGNSIEVTDHENPPAAGVSITA